MTRPSAVPECFALFATAPDGNIHAVVGWSDRFL
jgi:hypothetical protein